MVSFRELWQSVIDLLVTNAAGLGVRPECISKNTPTKEKPPQPPFVSVFCMPVSPEQSNTSSPAAGNASITIFVSAAPQNDNAEAMNQTVELAGRVVRVLSTVNELLYVGTDTVLELSSKYTVLEIDYSAYYDPSTDLLEA